MTQSLPIRSLALSVLTACVLAACGSRGGGGGSAPAPDCGSCARFVFALNSADGTLSRYAAQSDGTLRPMGYERVGATPIAMAVDPSQGFLVVANSATNDLSVFAIDPVDGALSEVAGSPFGAGAGPRALEFDPTGSFLYAANAQSDDVSGFTFDAGTGALAPLAGSPFAAGIEPVALEFEENLGRILFVANHTSDDVSAFEVALDGTLTPVAGSPFVSGDGPISLTATPATTNRFLFAACEGSGEVWAYDYDLAGALAPRASSPVAVGGVPSAVAIVGEVSSTAVTDHVLVVADAAQNELRVFTFDTTGDLVESAGSPVSSTGADPLALLVDPTSSFVYVANRTSDEVALFDLDRASPALVARFPTRTRAQPVALAVVRASDRVGFESRYAYIGNSDSDDLSAYFDFGGFQPMPGSPFLGGDEPVGLAVHPSGSFLYAANGGSNDVTAWSIDANGALTEIDTYPAGLSTEDLAIDPTGRFLYATNVNSQSVSGFAIAADGGLTELAGSPFAVGDSPENQGMDPQGRYLFVTGADVGQVVVFAIDQTSGALTHLTSVPAQIQLESIAVHPSGRFLYAGTNFTDEVLVYSVDPSGAPTLTGSVPTDDRPEGMSVDPLGRFLYVAHSNAGTVGAFRIDPTTGALTDLGSLSGPLDTQNVAVDAEGARVLVTSAAVDRVFVYSINPGGDLNLVDRLRTGVGPEPVTISYAIE